MYRVHVQDIEPQTFNRRTLCCHTATLYVDCSLSLPLFWLNVDRTYGFDHFDGKSGVDPILSSIRQIPISTVLYHLFFCISRLKLSCRCLEGFVFG